MKCLLFVIATIFVCSCSESEKIPNNPVDIPDDSTGTTVKISFNTIRHERLFFEEEPVNPLVVLRSMEEQEQFLDTTETLTSYINFSSYEDSMLIILISPDAISVSNHSGIDSLVPDTLTNIVTVHAHNYIPIGRMSSPTFHSHIVAISKIEAEFDLDIEEIYETTEGTVLPFETFLQHEGFFSFFSDTALLVTLSSQAEQDSFLNEINYVPEFPEFNYTDSMLVGVLSQQFNHGALFEIVSIIQFETVVHVNTQYFYAGMLPSVEGTYHFVSIPPNELPFVLESNIGIYPWYDGR